MHRLSHQVSWNITTRGSEPKLAQGGGAQHVNPARSACNPETCLIQMFHYGLFARQQVFHRVGKNVHVLGRFGDQLGQRCRCDLDALNIHNHLRQALLGDAVQNLQIGSQSRNSIAILSGGCYAFGNGGSGLCTAIMAPASVRTMFGDKRRWRQKKVKHLPGCGSYRFLWRKCRLTRLTLGQKMIRDLVRVLDPEFSSWSLIPANLGRCFHAISAR